MTGQEIWNLIRNLGGVAGLVIATVTIYRYAVPDKPELSGTCVSRPASGGDIPSSRLNELIGSDLSYPGLLQSLRDGSLCEDGKDCLSDVNLWTFSEDLSNRIRIATMLAAGPQVTCTLRNSGSRPAERVELALPVGYYLATSGGEMLGNLEDWMASTKQASPQSASRVVQLGEIRPDKSIQVDLWLTDRLWRPWLNDEELNLTHSTGTGKIQLGRTFYGTPASIAAFVESMTSMPPLLFFLLISLPLWALANLLIQGSQTARGSRLPAKVPPSSELKPGGLPEDPASEQGDEDPDRSPER